MISSPKSPKGLLRLAAVVFIGTVEQLVTFALGAASDSICRASFQAEAGQARGFTRQRVHEQVQTPISDAEEQQTTHRSNDAK